VLWKGWRNQTRSHLYRSASPRLPWHNKLHQRGCVPSSPSAVGDRADHFRSVYFPRTISARFSQMSCGGGSSHLPVTPPSKLRLIRVRCRDVGHAPVVLREQAQLLQPLVPRGLSSLVETEVELDLWRHVQLSVLNRTGFIPAGDLNRPLGGVRPFQQKTTCITQII